MGKNKNKQSYGTVYARKYSWANIKQYVSYAVLILVLVIGAGSFIYKKINPGKTNDQALTQPAVSETPGWWLRDFFGAGVCEQENCQPFSDPDGDKLTNAQEYYYHANPLKRDTNNNGLTDGQDVAAGYDPSRPGRIKFEEVENEDTALLESLVFDKDLIQTVGEMTSLDNVPIPEVLDAELNISKTNNRESILQYLSASRAVMEKYFPKNSGTYIESAMNSPFSSAAEQIAASAIIAQTELKKFAVPSDAVPLHKYQIALLELLPKVVTVPDQQAISDLSNQQATVWYDNTRSFSYIYQQISIETIKLYNQYEPQP